MKQLIAIAFLFIAFGVKAQDPFVTQRFNTPLFVNPALTGNGDKLNRLSFLYRDQWRSVPVPYVSTFLNYDRKLLDKNNNKLGGGIMFFYDKAGDGSLSTFHPSILFSYTRYFNEQKQSVSIGVRAGYLQRSLDRSKLTFDNQYGGSGFDPNLGTGENFSGTANMPDLGTGINFNTKMGELSSWDIGFAVYDPHQPKIGFTENTSDTRPIRFTTYLTADLFINPSWSLTPSFHFQGQEKAKEFHSSLYVTNHTTVKNQAFQWSLGGGYRNNDAAFAYTGFGVKDVHLGFSYDINTSAFADATNNKGGFEITLRYEFEREKEIIIDSSLVDTIDTSIVEDSIVEEMKEDTVVEIVETIQEVEEEPVEVVIPEAPEVVALRDIEGTLPLRLFFDNDHPNPRTWVGTTNMDYARSFDKYLSKREVFEQNIGAEATEDWFATITHSRLILDTLAANLEILVENGISIRVTLEGYTSPLAKSQYNSMLSMRRIQSVKLFLEQYNEGVLKPFIDNRTITIIENPYGESQTPVEVSDDAGNKRASIFDRSASYERRVEIIAIEVLE